MCSKCITKCKPQGPSCTFGKSWGLNTLQSANHKDHPCTFEKLGTKFKILVNHKDYPCTLLKVLVKITTKNFPYKMESYHFVQPHYRDKILQQREDA
ncbi:hypothetical protein Hanom_Chr10g00875161 [Helianthus anomalus]